MAVGNENILFGAEWDGSAVETGVNELVVKLAEAKDAEAKLKLEIKETTKEIANNSAALKANKEALDKATNPADVKKFTDNIKTLSDNEAVLNKNLKQQQTELIVVSKGVGVYNQEVNSLIKNQTLVGKQIEKFTSVNHLAAEGLGLFRRQVVDAGFALVSGFAGGIIAQALPAVTEFIEGLFNMETELTDLEKQQKIVNDVNEDSIKGYTSQVVKLEQVRLKLDDLNISQSDRVKLAKDYNKTAEEGNKIDISQINNIDLVNQAIDRQIEKIKQRAFARAAENVIVKKAEDLFLAQEKARQDAIERQKIDIQEGRTVFATPVLPGTKALPTLQDNVGVQLQLQADAIKQIANDPRVKDAQKEFDLALKALSPKIGIEGLFSDTKAGPETKTVSDNFAQRLRDLQAQLADVTEKSFQSDTTIREKFAAGLQKQLEGIQKEFEKDTRSSGVAGKTRVEVLVDLATEINKVQLQKSLEDFNRVRTEAEKKINDAIQQADHEASLKRIENIRNDFEREKQLIDERAAGVVEALNKRRDQLIKDLDKTNLNDEEKFLTATVITTTFKSLTDETETQRVQKQVENSFNAFEATVKEGNAKFEEELTTVNQEEAQQILAKKKLYEDGKITYKQFQDSLTRILAFGKNERSIILRAELSEQLAAKEAFLKNATDPEIIAQLESEIRSLKNGIAQIDSQVDKGEDPNAKRVENLKKYVAAVGQLLQTIVSFWQQVNAVEAAALDRSISLQEKRVENARDIADKGNAEYLEMEQKRLDELQAKREANAQKQLAINQALVLSQALLAAVSAIASAAQAPAGTGPFLAIAAGIAVLGAIAAAFSFVNSLQPPVATFFKGTESVEQGKNPSGIDTVPARLTVGERVVTAKENKDYYPTLTAIHNRKISPDVLNSFVKNVNTFQNNDIPVVNYERMSEAIQPSVAVDSIAHQKIDKLDSTMNRVVDAVAAIGINVNMDEQGFEASITKYSKRRKMRNRS